MFTFQSRYGHHKSSYLVYNISLLQILECGLYMSSKSIPTVQINSTRNYLTQKGSNLDRAF